jgi:glc operon protein GlcG
LRNIFNPKANVYKYVMKKLIMKKTLSLEAAKTLVARAAQKASELGVGAAIAVVDEGGHLICLERLDGTMVAAANITIGKAVTALSFDRPGIVLENTVTAERKAILALSGVTTMVPLMGSYPIRVDGETVGAIAVGGAGTGQNDEIIVLHALENFADYITC